MRLTGILFRVTLSFILNKANLDIMPRFFVYIFFYILTPFVNKKNVHWNAGPRRNI